MKQLNDNEWISSDKPELCIQVSQLRKEVKKKTTEKLQKKNKKKNQKEQASISKLRQ